jgi:Domain of unknown function (DUF4349)
MSAIGRIFPIKNPLLWKGVGLGVAVCVLLLILGLVLPNMLVMHKYAPAPMSYNSLARLQPAPGGGGGGGAESESEEADIAHADGPKIIRKAQLDLQVANCAGTQKKIEALAAAESGFLESSTVEDNSARITLRVPSARLDAVRGKLKELALRVKQDSVTASDVSKQYVDREARLRNLRAEEQQFLEIMKKARAVPDVLAVTKELSAVRGEIERADAEFRHLKDEIDMAEIDVTLASLAASGVHWNLGASTKSAFSDLLQSLADLADFLIWLVVNLPLIALWAVTIFLLVAGTWYVLKKAWRAMRAIFGSKPPQAPPAAPKS